MILLIYPRNSILLKVGVIGNNISNAKNAKLFVLFQFNHFLVLNMSIITINGTARLFTLRE